MTSRLPLFRCAARLWPLLLALLVACPASAAPIADGAQAQVPPTPLLWKISQPGQPGAVYLLGSFHALRANDYPWAPSVDAALAAADGVLFEISPDAMKSPSTAQAMLAAALLPAGQTLDAQLPESLRARVDSVAQAQGIPPAMLQRLKPWFASVLFTLQGMKALQFAPENGLDQRLADAALKAGKTTDGLETAAEQIGFLDATPPIEQVQMLSDSLDAVAQPDELERLHAAWRAGDAATLDRLANQPMKTKYPGLYQRILVSRNQAWVKRLAASMRAQPTATTLVVVGALHLIGEDSVVADLKRDGFTVERLR
jgi:uncharacterized protein YbaP (TraB family)